MPATRDQLFDRLASLGIESSTRQHPPVFTVEEARAHRGSIPGAHCKNLFLKDDRDAIWLIVALEDARIDLKTAPAKIGSKRLSFSKPELLREILGVDPGSVTPFGLINDTSCRTQVVLDQSLMANEWVNFHPLQNDATTSIRTVDLLAFIKSCGHEPRIVAVS